MDLIGYLENQQGIWLNPQQREAVFHTKGYTLLLSVPGSGKTTVLIARLANLLVNEGVPPEKILTLTFSRRSAADMSQRFRRLFPQLMPPRFSTIHSFCYGVVNHISLQYNRPLPQVLEDPSQLVGAIYRELEDTRFVEREKLDEVVNAIGFCKNRLISPEKAGEQVQVEDCDFPRLYQAYQERMKAAGQMDYDDMLLFTHHMFQRNPGFLAQYQQLYSHVCVDEAQDTSLSQYEIVELLAQKSGNLFLVGDEDQSIYGFRGAFPDALLNFSKKHPDGAVLKMEENYRSTPEVVRCAGRLIRQNTARIEKRMFTRREHGAQVQVHEFKRPSQQYTLLLELARKSEEGPLAVLYRYNESALPVMDLLSREGIPFSLRDPRDSLFEGVHIRDLLAFLRLAADPSDLESFGQIYAKTNAYFSRSVWDFVSRRHQPGKSVFQTLRQYPGMDGRRLENLRLSLERIGKTTPVNGLSLLEDVVSRNYFDSEAACRRLTLLKSMALQEQTLSAFLERIRLLPEIARIASRQEAPQVILSTLHSSKGLEFPRVALIDLIENQFPSKRALDQLPRGNREAYEEEVRLCYVGATRAIDQLYLLTFAEGNRALRPSRFVRLLTQDPPKPTSIPTPQNPAPTPPPVPKSIPGYHPVKGAEELSPGRQILHDQFGLGRILRLEGEFLTWFNGVETKRLSVKVCLSNRNLFIKNE